MNEEGIRSGETPATPRPPARRQHSLEKKRRIVEETFVPGASVSVVARRHDVNANQVFKWRLQYHRGELEVAGSVGQTSSQFIPVTVMEQSSRAASAPPTHSLPPPAASGNSVPSQVPAQAVRKPRTDLIKLELANGVKLSLHASIDTEALRKVLFILREVA